MATEDAVLMAGMADYSSAEQPSVELADVAFDATASAIRSTGEFIEGGRGYLFGGDDVIGEPGISADLRDSVLADIGKDPIGSVRKAHDWADEQLLAAFRGDAEAARNSADMASFVDQSGVSDALSAISSARLAYERPSEQLGGHLFDVGISGLATVAGPLVGSGFLKGILKGAPEVADVARAAPTGPVPVFESVLERSVASLPDKLGVQSLEGALGRKRHPKAGQVAEYTQDVKDKGTGEVIHKKGDKKLSKSGKEIVYPEHTYKDISAGEWADTNLDEFIETAKASGKKSISKDELIRHLEDNKVQIEEVRLVDNVPIPQEVLDLGVKRLQASRALRPEVESLSGVLAPGGNLGTIRHAFEQDPNHFRSLYNRYTDDLGDVDMYPDVPDDVSGVVSRLIKFVDDVERPDWTPKDASLITEARATVNAKLADPAYKKFVDQHSLSRVDSSSPGADPDFLKQARGIRRQHQALQEIARILNKMPEAESRLAALRKFENLPKHEEYSSIHRQHKTKLEVATRGMEAKQTQWKEHTVPGGEDYQEILLTVPVGPKLDKKFYDWYETSKPVSAPALHQRPGRREVPFNELDSYSKEDVYQLYEIEYPGSRPKNFTESHHVKTPNVMAHIRFKTRIDSKGRRIMFIEEIQSDWHQLGLKYGYTGLGKDVVVLESRSGKLVASFKTGDDAEAYILKNDPNMDRLEYADVSKDPDRVPNAPLKDTKEWAGFAVKRIFREAADQGFDGVAFTRADMITPIVTLGPDDAFDYIGNTGAFKARLAELKKKGGRWAGGAAQAEKTLKGNQYFYDQLLPSIVKKEMKARQSTTALEMTDEFGEGTYKGAIEVPFYELTKEVRDRAMKPQKLYNLLLPGFGAAGAGAAGAAKASKLDDETGNPLEMEEDPAFEGLKGDITQRDQEKRREEYLSQAASKVSGGVKAVGMAASLTPYDLGVGDYLYAAGELLDPEGDLKTAAIAAGAGLATGGVASGVLIARARAAKKALAVEKAQAARKAVYEKNLRDPEWIEQFLAGHPKKLSTGSGKSPDVDYAELKRRLDKAELKRRLDKAAGAKKKELTEFLDESINKSSTAPEHGLMYLLDYAEVDPDFKSYLRKSGIIVDLDETGNPFGDDYEPLKADVTDYVTDFQELGDEDFSIDELGRQSDMIVAEYASLSVDDQSGRRGGILVEWYDDVSAKLSSATELESDGAYARFLRGPEASLPAGGSGLDDLRGFTQSGYGSSMDGSLVARGLVEDVQRSRLAESLEQGSPMVDLYGRFGKLNRYLFSKARHYGEPVGTVQLSSGDKLVLGVDRENLDRLSRSGLITDLLYRELLGDVKLLPLGG
tara:strand:- start:360 stop:4367 length:4008 start_codon:yes stop_codon:yes gene_type:complete